MVFRNQHDIQIETQIKAIPVSHKMLTVGREVSSLTMKCKSTQLAPIARVGTDSERELVMARWGMPGPPQSLVQGGMDQDRAGFSADIAAISRQCTAAAGQ